LIVAFLITAGEIVTCSVFHLVTCTVSKRRPPLCSLRVGIANDEPLAQGPGPSRPRRKPCRASWPW
jgi:hypothetical protein